MVAISRAWYTTMAHIPWPLRQSITPGIALYNDPFFNKYQYYKYIITCTVWTLSCDYQLTNYIN